MSSNGGGEGREGDWECMNCQNRNYAFRSVCNRCKQPRVLVGTKNPTGSKGIPRPGDWRCSGCSNNTYASRDKCNRCDRPKEEAAIPAITMPGASLPTYAHYFARAQAQGLFGLRMNYEMMNGAGLPYNNWPYGGADRYGLQSGSSWPLGGSSSLYGDGNGNHLGALPKDWRDGDWMCNCGFHNYASRSQCKKCDAPIPSGGPSAGASAASDLFPGIGTKRLASDDFVREWDNKRLNAGDYNSHFLPNRQPNAYDMFDKFAGFGDGPFYGLNSKYPVRNPTSPMQSFQGKGGKQWRDGDWICTNCNNHNYASRSQCNRCKMDKEATAEDGNEVVV